MVYKMSDENLLKCARCGKYRVDCTEDFELNYRKNGDRDWLCPECNRFKSLFKDEINSDLMLVIVAKDDSDDCMVYSRDMYI